MKMKYAFFGNPKFAAIILEKLIEAQLPPALVISNPDKPIGREQTLTSNPVKTTAERHNIPIFQTETLRQKCRSSEAVLERKKWDLFVVAAYGKIIPPNMLLVPRLGTINVHPSLLPKYRGPTPIQNAILNGDEKIGVTLILLDDQVDHGPIIAQTELNGFKTQNSTLKTAEEKLAMLGAEMLIEVLPKFTRKEIMPVPQNHSKMTFTKKITTQDAFVPFDKLEQALAGSDAETVVRIDQMVRALNPEPSAWTITPDAPRLGLPKNKRVRLLEAEIKNGLLKLLKIQTEGKKPRSLH